MGLRRSTRLAGKGSTQPSQGPAPTHAAKGSRKEQTTKKKKKTNSKTTAPPKENNKLAKAFDLDKEEYWHYEYITGHEEIASDKVGVPPSIMLCIKWQGDETITKEPIYQFIHDAQEAVWDYATRNGLLQRPGWNSLFPEGYSPWKPGNQDAVVCPPPEAAKKVAIKPAALVDASNTAPLPRQGTLLLLQNHWGVNDHAGPKEVNANRRELIATPEPSDYYGALQV